MTSATLSSIYLNQRCVWKGLTPSPWTNYHHLSSRTLGSSPFHNARCIVSHALNMSGGQWDGPGELNLAHKMEPVIKLWESVPQPVKNFPWSKALRSFIQLIFDLVYAVAKYLCIPLMAVSSLSEMSYCAHERKMILIPIPLFLGIAVADVLKDTAIELSPDLKEGQFPWHLLSMVIFFTLLKLPGPFYPYWGRIFIPHFANGGLWRCLWFGFWWYRRPRDASKTSIDENQSE
eukprot:TRINITY_DN10779_c0_g1_i2.p1 TRINITY_DN10779_c0_g1~~TRINITY_DN10779_c0_g1_i2.p1  ORF type:complete len:244 (-),score=26.06 TRINITY_DN10779_c0_g1_i2:292-990(-)